MRWFAVLCFWSTAAAQTGVVVVESVPPGAIVRVDSARAGRTPLRATLPTGVHRVELTYAGYDVFATSVSVQPGAETTVSAALVRQTGTLTLADLPAGATVTIDGVPAGATATAPTGPVRVRVEVPGRRPAERTVRVEPLATTRVRYRARGVDPVALSLALFVPGSAQLLDRRLLAGAAVLGGIGVGIGVAVQARSAERQALAASDEAYARYLLATSEAEAVALRGEVSAAVDDARRAHRRQTSALAFAGAIYGAAAIDSALRFAVRPRLRAGRPIPAVVSADGAGVRIALTF